MGIVRMENGEVVFPLYEHPAYKCVMQIGQTCTQAALATVLEVSLETIFDILGKGDVHIQKIKDKLYPRCLVMDIEAHPLLPNSEYKGRELADYLNQEDALLYVSRGDKRHMYAWKEGHLYDPRLGCEVSMIYGELITAYIIRRIH